MKKIYLLTCSSKKGKHLHFLDLELAKKYLEKKKIEIKQKLGVRVVRDSALEFAFYFGWEETNIEWRILEEDIIEDENKTHLL